LDVAVLPHAFGLVLRLIDFSIEQKVRRLSLLLNEPENLAMLRDVKNDAIVVSVPSSSSSFGRLLRRVEDERRSLVIQQRGTPKAVLIGIRECLRLATPEPEVLRLIGQESARKGTDKLTSRHIDEVIKAARARKPKRG
jgi:prevent-host-death family protein